MSGKQCKIPGCGSHAINPHSYGREPGVDLDLCDVCYWRTRAETPLSNQKKQELYHIIHAEITSVRCKLRLITPDDIILAQVENKIGDRVKRVLNLSD